MRGFLSFSGVSAVGSTGRCGSTKGGHLSPCSRTQRAFLEEAASLLRLRSVVQLHGEGLWEVQGGLDEGMGSGR